jgi:dipeptide transport system permease protein
MTAEVLETPSTAAHAGTTPHPLSEFWSYFRANFGAVAGLVVIVVLVLLALFADLVAPHSPILTNNTVFLKPPFWQTGGSLSYPLGTDAIGRDILSRLIYGARLSLLIGIAVVALSVAAGTILGLVAGFFRGVTEIAIMRLMDITLTLPSLFARHRDRCDPRTRPDERDAGGRDCPAAALCADRARRGDHRGLQGLRHGREGRGRRPAAVDVQGSAAGCTAPLIVQATLGISTAILDAAALGFLGLGAQPPSPEWGTMLADAREFVLRAWWVVTLPGIAILVTVLAFNLLGDGLRDALDPKLKR